MFSSSSWHYRPFEPASDDAKAVVCFAVVASVPWEKPGVGCVFTESSVGASAVPEVEVDAPSSVVVVEHFTCVEDGSASVIHGAVRRVDAMVGVGRVNRAKVCT